MTLRLSWKAFRRLAEEDAAHHFVAFVPQLGLKMTSGWTWWDPQPPVRCPVSQHSAQAEQEPCKPAWYDHKMVALSPTLSEPERLGCGKANGLCFISSFGAQNWTCMTYSFSAHPHNGAKQPGAMLWLPSKLLYVAQNTETTQAEVVVLRSPRKMFPPLATSLSPSGSASAETLCGCVRARCRKTGGVGMFPGGGVGRAEARFEGSQDCWNVTLSQAIRKYYVPNSHYPSDSWIPLVTQVFASVLFPCHLVCL